MALMISHETRMPDRGRGLREAEADSKLNYLETLSKGRFVDNNHLIITFTSRHVDVDQTSTS
jgi:hypothetical protein